MPSAAIAVNINARRAKNERLWAKPDRLMSTPFFMANLPKKAPFQADSLD